MKVYDKEIYTKQESIKTTVIMIVVFLLGFVAGYLANSYSNSNNVKSEGNELVIPSVNQNQLDDSSKDIIAQVDEEIINLTNSQDYLDMRIEDKADAVDKLLNNLKEQGKITEYSYSEEEGYYSFKYQNGALGVVQLEGFNSEDN